MSCLGIELAPDVLRVVALGRGHPRTLEVEWTPGTLGAAVADVLDRLGASRAVAVAIHPALLRVRRLELPPLPTPERRQALALESDRYFASDESLAFSLPGTDGLAFAAPEAELNRWIEALEPLGPLVRIEPAAVAVARALVDVGIRDAKLIRPMADGAEWVHLRDGEVAAARRVFGTPATVAAETRHGEATATVLVEPWPDEVAPNGEDAGIAPVEPAPAAAPSPEGVPPGFLAAYGAAMDRTEAWESGFVTGSLAEAVGRRRRRRGVGVSMALLAALAFLVLSWGAYRDRVETRIDDRIEALRAEAVPVMTLESDVATLQRSIEALDRIGEARPDVLASLRALTNTLPADTWIRTINVSGEEWQIQGTGADAAALIPLLEEDPRFEDVRFAAATRRVQTQTESYDDFAIDLRATGPSDGP